MAIQTTLMREGVLDICSEVDAIFFVLGTKCQDLNEEGLASAWVCAMTGVVGCQEDATAPAPWVSRPIRAA